MNGAFMDADPVRWFSALGTCRCGKPATGTLMGPRNESYGVSCLKCADVRLKKAAAERATLALRMQERAP
jgi:hypothetical protein